MTVLLPALVSLLRTNSAEQCQSPGLEPLRIMGLNDELLCDLSV